MREDLCACGCGRVLSPLRVGAWRDDCALRLLSEIAALSGSAVLAAMAADAGALTLARALGALPFDVGRT